MSLDLILRERDLAGKVWPTDRVILGSRTCKSLSKFFAEECWCSVQVAMSARKNATRRELMAMTFLPFRSLGIILVFTRLANAKWLQPLQVAVRRASGAGWRGIVELHADFTAMEDRPVSMLSAMIPSFSGSLSVLNLSWNQLSDAGLGTLLPVLAEHSSLQRLQLGGCGLGVEGVKMLSSLLRSCDSLLHVDLHHNLIGPSSIRLVGEALAGTSMLESLDVSENMIGSSGVGDLFASLPCSVRKLNLWNNRIHPEGCRRLAASLPRLQLLQSLTLRNNDIKDAGCSLIVNHVSRGIRHLDLRENMITQEGARAIAENLLSMSEISCLMLDTNFIGDDGAKHIVLSLPSCQSLMDFHFSNNGISNHLHRMLKVSAGKKCKLHVWEFEELFGFKTSSHNHLQNIVI